MSEHDPLCPDATICDEGDGWLCDLAAEARVDGIRRALAAIDALSTADPCDAGRCPTCDADTADFRAKD